MTFKKKKIEQEPQLQEKEKAPEATPGRLEWTVSWWGIITHSDISQPIL